MKKIDNIELKKNKNARPLIFILVGILLMLFALGFVIDVYFDYHKENVYKADGIKIQGIITEVYKNNSAKVTYEVDNQNYTVESGEYHNCMFDVGEKVDVYYKLENPEDAVIVLI